MQALIKIPLGVTLLVMIMITADQVNARPKFYLVETEDAIENLVKVDKVRIFRSKMSLEQRQTGNLNAWIQIFWSTPGSRPPHSDLNLISEI